MEKCQRKLHFRGHVPSENPPSPDRDVKGGRFFVSLCRRGKKIAEEARETLKTAIPAMIQSAAHHQLEDLRERN